MTPGDAESPQGLELDPHSLLVFNLSRSTDGAGSTDPDGAPSAKCELSLRHSGTSAQHLAFKVGNHCTASMMHPSREKR